PGRTKASPRILSFPGAPWRSTGRLGTTMHARAWPIPKCLSFRIGWKGYAHSIAARSGADIELSASLGYSCSVFGRGIAMKESDVRARAFAMPLTSPAYPVGPYRFVNREYLIITYRTDPQKLRELVPEPLQIEEPLVKFEFIRMPFKIKVERPVFRSPVSIADIKHFTSGSGSNFMEASGLMSPAGSSAPIAALLIHRPSGRQLSNTRTLSFRFLSDGEMLPNVR